MRKRYQDPIRKLARSSYYQTLYARAKELAFVRLFENTADFSKIQYEFLYWLALYNRLYHDLAAGERYLTEDIINDDFLCDCYLIWEEKVKRKLELDEIKSSGRHQNKNSSGKQIDHSSAVPSVVFTK